MVIVNMLPQIYKNYNCFNLKAITFNSLIIIASLREIKLLIDCNNKRNNLSAATRFYKMPV